MATPRYITPQGFQVLAAEHWDIWTVQRPRIVAAVEAAAALGDRSDNADYRFGKRKLYELDRRLRFLSERMDALTVLAPEPHPSGRAYFGAWVTLELEEGGERTYRLVGPDEFDLARGLLSVDSPMGRALLAKGPGDTAVVPRPGGPIEVTVVAVRYEEGAAATAPAGKAVRPRARASAPTSTRTPSSLVAHPGRSGGAVGARARGASTRTSTSTSSSLAAHPERSGGVADAKSRGTRTSTRAAPRSTRSPRKPR